jgi:gliding motility-associated-like protein
VSTTLDFDPCEVSNRVDWTPYGGWENEISGYRVYGGLAGDSARMLKFLHPSSRSYTHRDVNLDTSYVYYVETVHTSGKNSLSPLDTIETRYPDPPSLLRIDQVEVIDRLNREIFFSHDADASVDQFRILRRTNSQNPFQEVALINNPGEGSLSVVDQVSVAGQSFEYLAEALHKPGGCRDPVVLATSNPGTSIFLESQVEEQMAVLSWTPYQTYESGLSGYLVQRRGGSGEFIDVASLAPEMTSWREPIETVINGFQPGRLQYRVLAISNQVEGGNPGISPSNVTDVTVESTLQVPNAFTPGSNDMNFAFKPRMDFAPKEYTLIIFDRAGRKLFETSDPSLGWDGRGRSGGYVSEGVYVYYIQYTDYTNRTQSLHGNVTAIYP